MAEIQPCPNCGKTVSELADQCYWCGKVIAGPPDAITPELIDSLLDVELPMLLDRYACKCLSEQGCYELDGPKDVDVLAKLPRPIRVAYTLISLDTQVNNGGFWQFFTNSSGQIVDEALEDLRLIGATDHIPIVEAAIAINHELESKYPSYANRFERPEPEPTDEEEQAFWTDVEGNCESELDKLASKFYLMEHEDSKWNYFKTYIRDHVSECEHDSRRM